MPGAGECLLEPCEDDFSPQDPIHVDAARLDGDDGQ
jgi:hypothetical protein